MNTFILIQWKLDITGMIGVGEIWGGGGGGKLYPVPVNTCLQWNAYKFPNDLILSYYFY